ncbi:6516_t:CDS:2, partial [Entrophospora sp. SA101]
LSAYGLALADVVHEVQEPSSLIYSEKTLPHIQERVKVLVNDCANVLSSQYQITDESTIHYEIYLNLRYQGTDFALMTLKPKDSWNFIDTFVEQYKQEFGFNLSDRDICVDDIRIRGIGKSQQLTNNSVYEEIKSLKRIPLESSHKTYPMYFEEHGRLETPVYLLDNLIVGNYIQGPAMIIDANSTILVTPSCNAHITSTHIMIMVGDGVRSQVTTESDPIQLSIFGHRFMSIAEQMGNTLQKTAISTNIKERLDFSCALFGPDGGLVANGQLEDGDVILTNHPQAGDITVITPVFNEGKIVFFVASRGHHADIGGSLPGSMPPNSNELYQEGAAVKSFKLISKGKFDLEGLTNILSVEPAKYPGCSGTRCFRDNESDLKAQVAANHKGITLVKLLIQEYGLDVVQAYMMHIRKNAELSVRWLLRDVSKRFGRNTLKATDHMDDGSPIKLEITIDDKEGSAVFDFNGTGPEVYGCLAPIDIRIPEKSFLNPSDKAAVVGGNVLTSQRLVDVLYT